MESYFNYCRKHQVQFLSLCILTAFVTVSSAPTDIDKFCTNPALHNPTITAICINRNNVSIPCEPEVTAGTRAKLTCSIGYAFPQHQVHDVITCDSEGEWDFHPFRCTPDCGTKESTTSVSPNTMNAPWHVALYKRNEQQTPHIICGGTILNAKLVITAAHCFSMESNYDVYSVGAGKYHSKYDAAEALPTQFMNVSKVHIPPRFNMEISLFSDIALIVLEDYIRFLPHIKPICWESATQSNPSSPRLANKTGELAGWSFDQITLAKEAELNVLTLDTLDGDECQAKSEVQESGHHVGWASDKFCVHAPCSLNAPISGSGLVMQKIVGENERYFLHGVVSNQLTGFKKCDIFKYIALTNTDRYKDFILMYSASTI